MDGVVRWSLGRPDGPLQGLPVACGGLRRPSEWVGSSSPAYGRLAALAYHSYAILEPRPLSQLASRS